jgi:phosphoribosylformylglycinamidine synthase
VKVAVLKFPGSNCDQDALFSLRDDVGVGAEYVWHQSTSLAGFDAVFIPGGFSYGDYLRCGAMASRAPIMAEVQRFAAEGRPIIGACNGFQILCEAGLLPGALMLNAAEKFVCRRVTLDAVNQTSIWTQGVKGTLEIPIAHGEGRYVADDETLARLEGDGLVAFRYRENPNGSANDIAGVVNPAGNILGLMPHPERATRATLGSTDGLFILRALTLVAA